MGYRISEQKKIDPTGVQQNFSDLNIRLFCCRYWILEEWECIDLKVPFWRIYYNSIPGSSIRHKDKMISLNEETILIIPPNISFSSELKENHPRTHESIKGRSFQQSDQLQVLSEKGNVDHLFIHFSLGYPLDFMNSDIFEIQFKPDHRELMNEIKTACINNTITGLRESLLTKQLILNCLFKLPASIWETENLDHRILKAIKLIESNYHLKTTNHELADAANMATNSFARLFKISTGITTQQYILKIKVQAAVNLMHHTTKSLDEIAFECGFSDRHHFSKVFKKIQQVNPSAYKKRLKMNPYNLS